MFRLLKRIGKYLSTAANSKFDELADPKVQLTQAIEEAQDQHRKLKQQAASVIANQKQTSMRLNRSMSELEKTTNSARQAVLMADTAAQAGDAAKTKEFTEIAETLATKMITIESEVESLKEMHLQTSQAAEQAKNAVNNNALAMQRKLNERQRLMSQLDQVKMQEQLNKAMSTLSEQIGQDVPTLDQVRNKIEERYAKALGAAELIDLSAEMHMLEIEKAQMDADAQFRLDGLRGQLGLNPGQPAVVELDAAPSTVDIETKTAEPVESVESKETTNRKG